MRNWYLFQIIKKLLLPLLLLMLLVLAGVIGYMVIEGYTFLEALYMTVITLASVGYNEVRPLSDNGRIFTVILIIINLGLLTLFITMVTRYLMDGDFLRQYKLFHMHNEIRKLHDHVIICGFGRNGKEAAQVLKENRTNFVVIEEKDIDEAEQSPYMHHLKGNATQDELLIYAGLQHAKALITTLPNDADNLFVVLTAKQYNPNVTIISRASQDTTVQKLKIAGANNVIMPDKLGGAHMAKLILNPDVMEFLLMLTGKNGNDFRVQEIVATTSKSLGDIDLWKQTGCTILGIRKDNDFKLNPDSKQMINQGDRLIIMGGDDQIKKALQLI